ncbi:hypothetical protein RB195_025174 [Necator americanus]|uniref:Uncharacterized protein n=1 Tax=Necator americanus TaxID=51031 RepID=A0ABR1ER62_NECAM
MSIENYTKYCGEFVSASSRCAFVRLRDCRGRELWADELNALVSKIPSQQVVIVGIDANAKMAREQQKKKEKVLNTATGKAVNRVGVGVVTPPIWSDYSKTLLNRQAPSAPKPEHVHRPTYAVNEEPPTGTGSGLCTEDEKWKIWWKRRD